MQSGSFMKKMPVKINNCVSVCLSVCIISTVFIYGSILMNETSNDGEFYLVVPSLSSIFCGSPPLPPPPGGKNRGAHKGNYAPDWFYSKMIERKVVLRRILGKSYHKCRCPPGTPLAPRGGIGGMRGSILQIRFTAK